MFPACLFPTCRSRSLRINHPQWFPELSSDSTDVEIAKVLYMHGNKNCPRVCAPARKPTKKTAAHMGLSQKGWNVPWGTSEIWLIKSRFKGKVIHFRLLFCVWDFPIFGGWGDTRNVPWKRPNDLFVKQVWLTKRKGILCLGCRLQKSCGKQQKTAGFQCFDQSESANACQKRCVLQYLLCEFSMFFFPWPNFQICYVHIRDVPSDKVQDYDP